MEDLYKVLQVAPGADREAIEAAYQRLKAQGGGTVTADLDHAYQTLSDPRRRRIYDNARIDPRGLRALFNIEGRQEKVVWNVEGRVGEEPPPPAPPLDPWGLDNRDRDEPFDGQIELFDPLEENGSRSTSGDPEVWGSEPEPADDELETPPGQEIFAWDQSVEPTLEPVSEEVVGAPQPPPEPKAEPAVIEESAAVVAKPKARSAAKKKSRRTATAKSATTRGDARTNGKKPSPAKSKPPAKDRRRHARTAASQLLAAAPVDLEAITLTSYNPEDFAQERPPSWWNPMNLLSLLSFAIFTAAAIGGVYYIWDSTRDQDDEVARVASDDVLATLAPPPEVSGDAVLPANLEEAARAYVESFSGPLGERYTYLGTTGSVLPDGSFFYAVAARDRGSLDGTHQRIFFFINDALLGTDWPSDSRSIAEVEALPDGRISVVYNAFAEGDLPCCGSLEAVTVVFSYDGALTATLSEPPVQILAR